MRKRATIPIAIQTNVLISCRRRCCLCFFLEQDSEVKDGQIAHLDREPANNAEENLAFLCMRHHSQYDAGGSRAKGLTIGEVKHARDVLYEALSCSTDTELLEVVVNPGLFTNRLRVV